MTWIISLRACLAHMLAQDGQLYKSKSNEFAIGTYRQDDSPILTVNILHQSRE